jgi:hypothetical protein
MSNSNFRSLTVSVLGAGALLLAAGLTADPAFAQAAAPRGPAAASAAQRPMPTQRPATAQRPAGLPSQARIPAQATERMPVQATERRDAAGTGLAAGSAGDGLAAAAENAAEQAKAYAPPLGGTPPSGADAGEQGLAIARENAAEEAKAVAAPLGGDPANAGEGAEEPEQAETPPSE